MMTVTEEAPASSPEPVEVKQEETSPAAEAQAEQKPEAKPKKWTSLAGPVMTKKVSEAINKIRVEGCSYTELWGVKGGEEHRSDFYSPFSPARAEAGQKMTELGEKYQWTVTRKNYTEIIADAQAAVVELRKTRPVTDKRQTPDECAEQQRQHQEAEAKRRQEESEKREAVAAKVIELQPHYPWAIGPRDGLSDNARAGKNARTLLGQKFQDIAFTVHTDYNSIRVAWEFGPTDKAVTAAMQVFKSGEYKHDGGDGYMAHDNSVTGKALEVILGRVTYVSTSRRFPSEIYEQVGRFICDSEGKPFQGLDMRHVGGADDDDRLSDHVYRVLAQTDFPYGAKIIGAYRTNADWEAFSAAMRAKYGDGCFAKDRRAAMAPEDLAKLQALEAQDEARTEHQEPWGLKIEAQVQKPPTESAANSSGVVVRHNREHNGVEIAFPAKPSADVISRLKANGFRWFMPSHCWYKRYTDVAWQIAFEIAGIPIVEPPTVPASPDPVDMAYEDRSAEAAGIDTLARPD